MNVLVLGASGVIGQHMRLCVPDGIEPIFCRREADALHQSFKLTKWMSIETADREGIQERLREHSPDVVINLAGWSETDAVEHTYDGGACINLHAPVELARLCAAAGAMYIHISTQAVFDGANPPYVPGSPLNSVNRYGANKVNAEREVRSAYCATTIVRPTFILGIRPLPRVGRPNPIEQMLVGQPRQVADRWFSPLFARDAAALLWRIVQEGHRGEIIHLGIPRRVSRYEIATLLDLDVESVSHDDFPGLAPRPIDTTYAEGSWYLRGLHQGLGECREDWEDLQRLGLRTRAREIALFLGLTEAAAYTRLHTGFAQLHGDVATDFRRYTCRTDEDLLRWYRETESYIWELSAYHCDEGFNYAGMCRGITEHLKAAGARRVLCLADGIGDATLTLRRAGIEAVYHDLEGSRTAAFARFRYWMHTGGELRTHNSTSWRPELLNGAGPYDAVVCLDFLEHVPDVRLWATAMRDCLRPGGLLCAQNAFGVGSGPSGSIPMHLPCNDRYERDWDPLMAELGMRQESSNWYRKEA